MLPACLNTQTANLSILSTLTMLTPAMETGQNILTAGLTKLGPLAAGATILTTLRTYYIDHWCSYSHRWNWYIDR